MTTKEKLIKTTARLLQTKGYYGTGIAEILQITTVPKGSLYHHFPKGKDGLVTEALKFAKDRQLENYSNAIGKKRSPKVILESIINYLSDELVDSNFEKGCPLSTVALEVASTNEEIRLVCSDMFNHIQNRLAALLRNLEEPNPSEKANTFFTLLEGGYVLSKTHKEIKYLRNVNNHIKSILGQ